MQYGNMPIEEKREIVKLLKSYQYTVNQIAEMYDRSPATIYNIAIEYNLATKSSRLDKNEVDRRLNH